MEKRLAVLGLVAAVGVVVGAAGGSWLASEGRPVRAERIPSEERSAERDGRELAAVLAEMTRTLDALRAALERPRAAAATAADGSMPPAERVPLDSPATLRDDLELVPALHALAASLRDLDLGARGSGGGRASLLVPRYVDRRAAFASAGMRAAQVADDELAWDQAMKAWRSKHLFWTAQQVLDVYGKPDEIESGDGQAAWIYRLPVDDEQEECFYFRFDDGLVYGAEYDF